MAPHSPPPSKDGDDMIGIAVRFEVEDQGWKSDDTQGGGGKDGTLETGGAFIAQDLAGRGRCQVKIVRKSIQISLNALWRFQPPQGAEFWRAKTDFSPSTNYNPTGWRASKPGACRTVGCQRGAQRSRPVT